MKVRVNASTKPGFQLSVEDAMLMSGHAAGICYMRDDYDSIANEPVERTMKRANGTIKSKHHSTSGHANYTLLFERMPKIMAMLLNNEKDYNTSEKSARYTVMETSGEEKRIYEKWTAKFEELIAQKYPQIKEATRKKLALENARYFISVFTPATDMEYTADFRQINYMIGFCEKMLLEADRKNPFMQKMLPYVAELEQLLRSVCNVEGLRDAKGRRFSLFTEDTRTEYFGDVYSVNYLASFAQLAQAQRHRTLWYEMQIPDLDDCAFFVPPIIGDDDIELRAEYLHDMAALKENFPQGMLVHVNERGPLEAFTLKCHERLCGAAQLEICLRTQETLDRYISNAVSNGYPDVYKKLEPFANKTKCQFGHYQCDRPCPLGPQHAFDRLI